MSGVRRNPHIPGAQLEQSDALSSRNADSQGDHQRQNEGGLLGAQVKPWKLSNDCCTYSYYVGEENSFNCRLIVILVIH
jgi:hypothetical protein